MATDAEKKAERFESRYQDMVAEFRVAVEALRERNNYQLAGALQRASDRMYEMEKLASDSIDKESIRFAGEMIDILDGKP